MRQSTCLGFNLIIVDYNAASLNCRQAGRASDYEYDSPDLKLLLIVGRCRRFLSLAWPTGVQLVFSFAPDFQ